jgi:peptidoglycan/LPS O-acetylase OafA/YrhL
MAPIATEAGPAPGRPSTPPRLEFLDGLRALAALAVLVHHAQLQIWSDVNGGLGLPSLYIGHLAVNVFIVLSGFCLMLPVLKAGGRLPGGPARFFRRRARRILPPYYGALALSLLLIWLFVGADTGTHWDVSVPVTTNGIVAHMLLLQDVLHRGEINHPFSSIAVEWKIYFLFPLLLLLDKRIGALAATALVVTGSCLAFLGLRGTLLFGLTPHYLGLFALGMLGASLTRGGGATAVPRIVWPAAGGGLLLLAVVLMERGWGLRLSAPRALLLDVVVGLLTMVALVLCETRPQSGLCRLLSAKPLVSIGVVSYSLYLIHAPLLQVVWQYGLSDLGLVPSSTFVLLLGLGGPAILGASYLFFLLCERPFMSAGAPAAKERAGARLAPGAVLS